MLALAGCVLAGCGSTKPTQREMDLALIRAAEAGDIAEMKRLLGAGADINAADADGWTPYLAASSMGRFEAMRMLKALGARTYVDEGPPVAPPI
jgi:ankyrin repeat protein